ncbi:MAG: hypothetical protein SW127_21665 [Actinomycetota bacterium]|nr:hypothetical protein [Actinomycetota bacterium]
MTPKTRFIVEHADLSELGAAANAVQPVSDGISRAADDMHRTIHGLDWKGQSRVDATGRADSEKTQMHRVSSAVDALKAALTGGQAAMAPMVENLKSSTRNLEAASYEVSNDWNVTDGYEYGLAEAFAAGDPAEEARIAELKRQRAEEAQNATVRLTRLAQELDAADAACAQAVREANDEIGSTAPVAAGLLGRQGTSDLQALRTATATPEQRARLFAATQLTPDQLDALREGHPAYMSQGQFDYLQSVMKGLDGVSLEEMGDIEKHTPGQLGDAIRLMSIPNLQTASGEKGGIGQLPISVRTLLQDSPTRLDTAVVGPTIQTFTDVPRLNDFRTLNTMLSHGDQGFRLGADVDRGLLKQASEISGNLSPRGSDAYYGTYDHRIDSGELRQTVDAMFHNASGDHQAVADFLTGDNMDVTVTPGNHYNADTHVVNLLDTKWESDELGAKSVLGWMGDSAGAPGYEGEAAGRSMSALADVMVKNHDSLAHISVGDDKYSSFGQLNPELAQSIARSASPFIGNFVDAPDQMLVNHHASEMGSTADFAKFAGLLATDQTAGDMVVHSSSTWESYMAYEFGGSSS